jgi:hypothetical protein
MPPNLLDDPGGFSQTLEAPLDGGQAPEIVPAEPMAPPREGGRYSFDPATGIYTRIE